MICIVLKTKVILNYDNMSSMDGDSEYSFKYTKKQNIKNETLWQIF